MIPSGLCYIRRVNAHIKIFLVMVLSGMGGPLLQAQPSAPNADAEFERIFQSAPARPSPLVLNEAETAMFLDLAEARGWNPFDLLPRAVNFLKSRGLRARLEGPTLRSLGRTYRLSDGWIDVLLPLSKVRRIELGAPTGPGQAELDFYLTGPHEGRFWEGDFALDAHYGFRRVVGLAMTEAFGARYRFGPVPMDLEKIEWTPDPLHEGNVNYVAIHARFFFRPKRWHFDPVRKWRPGEERPVY